MTGNVARMTREDGFNVACMTRGEEFTGLWWSNLG